MTTSFRKHAQRCEIAANKGLLLFSLPPLHLPLRRYRIGNVRPGGYRICADFYSAVPAPTSGLIDFASRSEPRFYTRSCYGGSRPANLRLAPGQRAGIDLTLGTTSAVWLRGRMPAPS